MFFYNLKLNLYDINLLLLYTIFMPSETGAYIARQSKFDKRIHEIDLARGLLICLVLFDHILNQCAKTSAFGGFYDFCNWYWNSGIRFFVQQYLALPAFVFISGVSCAFSKSSWKRAAQMVLAWGLVSVVTNLMYSTGLSDYFGTNFKIDFNIIGVLAWSQLIFCFFENRSNKVLLAMAIIFFGINELVIPNLYKLTVESGHLDVSNVPALWYSRREILADQMTLFPSICWFFLGAIAGKIFYPAPATSKFKRHEWERGICFIGRHSLWFYILHQIILIPIFLGLRAILGY